MSGKTKGSGLGARMAATPAVSAVAAGFAAARGSELPEAEIPGKSDPAAKAEVVALNIRLPKALHRTLRERAFKDDDSINAILIRAANEWLAKID